MKRPYYNGWVLLNDRTTADAHLVCAERGSCVCGFCKGVGQCEWGDCHNRLPTVGSGTLCLDCTANGYARFPGHRPSVAVKSEA